MPGGQGVFLVHPAFPWVGYPIGENNLLTDSGEEAKFGRADNIYRGRNLLGDLPQYRLKVFEKWKAS